MITTILLDLDDTILDFHKAEKEALKKALQKIGVEPTEALLKRYSEINLSQWKLLELGKLTQAEVKINRYRIFFEECGIQASPEETAKCFEHNLAYEHEKVEGALELLQKLHGKYRLYAASNGTYEVQKRRIEESGIKPYFEDFFISKKIGFHKPDKKFFDYCFAHIPDFKLEESVMVGDSLSSDILGGKNAGLTTIWYQKNRNITDDGAIHPDYRIYELSELPDLLEKIE